MSSTNPRIGADDVLAGTYFAARTLSVKRTAIGSVQYWAVARWAPCAVLVVDYGSPHLLFQHRQVNFVSGAGAVPIPVLARRL